MKKTFKKFSGTFPAIGDNMSAYISGEQPDDAQASQEANDQDATEQPTWAPKAFE